MRMASPALPRSEHSRQQRIAMTTFHPAFTGGRVFHYAMGLVLIAALSACQSSTAQNAGGGSGKSASLRTMEQVAIAAHKCWFASRDPAFKPYRMANELNSFSGRPRFLLVPAKNYEAKPLLVVQAEGASRKVETFGPLLGEALGPRISADISRWASGDSHCGSSA
jgi:hypothetical protein